MVQSKFLFFLLIPILGGCGVKGKPMPPLVPAPIGRGEPVYSEATATKKPVKNKYNYKLKEDEDSAKASSSGE